MNSIPSAGAIRAVAEIFGLTPDPGRLNKPLIDTPMGVKSVTEVAEIIDECTATLDLLEACKYLLSCCELKDIRLSPVTRQYIEFANTAIEKVESRQLPVT